MKLDLSNHILRQAIWESYSTKCYYSHNPIKRNEMELDHVIPRYLLDKPKALKQILSTFNLPSDFNILSLKNIVPCSSEENRKKGKNILPNTPNILVDVERRLKKIEKVHNRLMREMNDGKSMSYLIESVRSGETSPEDVHNFITEVKPTFEQSQTYTKDFRYAYFSGSTKRVILDGFLPRPNMDKAPCCVRFKSLELRGLMFTLSEEEVFELTLPSHREMTSNVRPNPRDFPKSKDCVMFKYKGINFFLDYEEMNGFYDLLKVYKDKIICHRKKLDAYYGTENFEPSPLKNGFRLGKIKRGLWNLMLDFSQEYDFGNGDTAWHIFDAKMNILAVNSGRNVDKRYSTGFHTMLTPEQISQRDSFNFRTNDDGMWIVWNKKLPNESFNTIATYSTREIWNAKMSYQWLTQEFIPYIIWYYEVSKKEKILKYKSFERFKLTFNIGKYMWP